MKEKTYKTAKLACKEQKLGEAAVYDKTKKKYVNIKDFPPFKDPFKYNELHTYASALIGAVIGYAIAEVQGMVAFGIVVGFTHWWYRYKRFN